MASYDGKLVTLRGILVAGKGTTLLGVSVRDQAREMCGLLVEATGWLERRYIPIPADPFDANTGRVGEFFVLKDADVAGHLATVRLVQINER